MPRYHQLGELPSKRHKIYRQPSGELYAEELMGNMGFVGPASLLYHVRRPTAVRALRLIREVRWECAPPEPLRHRHFRTKQLSRRSNSITERTPLLFNSDVSMEIVHPAEELSSFYRNAQGDEIVYVSQGAGTLERGIVLAFFGCMLVTNVAALARFRSDSVLDSGRNRLQALQPVLSTKDCILVLSLQDETIEFVYAHPYSQLSRDRYLLTPAVPWGTIHVRQWREQLAGHIQNVWKHDGRIWISRRLFAPRPNPAWNWVEGDDPRVSWAEVRTFFCSLDLGTSVGGADGFSELARTPKNEAMMAELTGPITSARIQTP